MHSSAVVESEPQSAPTQEQPEMGQHEPPRQTQPISASQRPSPRASWSRQTPIGAASLIGPPSGAHAHPS